MTTVQDCFHLFHARLLELRKGYKTDQDLAAAIKVRPTTVGRWLKMKVHGVSLENYLTVMGSLPPVDPSPLASPSDSPELTAHLAAVRYILTEGEPWMRDGLIANIQAFSGYLRFIHKKGRGSGKSTHLQAGNDVRGRGQPNDEESHRLDPRQSRIIG